MKSNCCNAEVKVMPTREGVTTRWYECSECGLPCGVRDNPKEEK